MRSFTFFILFCFSICLSAQGLQFEPLTIPHLTTKSSDSRSANFVDLNGDGWDDIFISNSAGSGGLSNNFLYINKKNGNFERIFDDPIVGSMARFVSASFADADNDGDLDAYVVSWGSNNKNYFYRNNGDASFSYESDNVSGSITNFSESVAWIDANRDNKLDIYFTNSYIDLKNAYYENSGDGVYDSNNSIEFTDELLSTRSVDWVDYDNDGDMDLFLTNEGNSRNSLFRNDGIDQFTKVTGLNIVKELRNSTGSSWGDIDNDGDMDLFVANYANLGQKNQLYRNMGDDFQEESAFSAIDVKSSSFGSTFGDLDNDGDLDLIVCNSYLGSVTKNYVYINDGTGSFTKDTESALANFSTQSYGVALGDLDNDGWLDVLLTNNRNGNEPNSLFKNVGQGNNWVKFNCKGVVSNTSAIGTIVKLKSTMNGAATSQTRYITSSSGTCGQNSYAVHFGLADSEIVDEVIIQWPSGNIDVYSDLPINTIYDMVERNTTNGNVLTNVDFSVYPNPASSDITLDWEENVQEVYFRLYDMKGNLVCVKYLNHANDSIDVTKLANGSYIYEVTIDDSVIRDSIIIHK